MCVPSSSWSTMKNDHPFCSPIRNFNSDFLSCDCGLRWVPGFFRTSSPRLGDETLCAHPRSLRGKPLRGLRENQLNCGKILAPNSLHLNEAVHRSPKKRSLLNDTDCVLTNALSQHAPPGVAFFFFFFFGSLSMRAACKRFSSRCLERDIFPKAAAGCWQLTLWFAFMNWCSLHPIWLKRQAHNSFLTELMTWQHNEQT